MKNVCQAKEVFDGYIGINVVKIMQISAAENCFGGSGGQSIYLRKHDDLLYKLLLDAIMIFICYLQQPESCVCRFR